MSTLKVNNITDLGDDAVVTSGVLDTLAVPAGGILQVVSTTLASPFSTATAGRTLVEITGLNATITPSSTSSKIFIIVNVQMASSLGGGSIAIYRDATQIALGDNTPSPRTSNTDGTITTSAQANVPATFLDSPATTSAITYKVYGAQQASGSSVTWYVNRSSADNVRTISNITLMEVAG